MKLPRFNLRDLFWLVLVMAMGCGWWVDRSIQTRAVGTLSVWVRSHCNGYVYWDGTTIMVRDK